MTGLTTLLRSFLAVALFATIAVATIAYAPRANADVFEKLVMPGRVIEGHADVESDCAACHDADSDEALTSLCTSCHEDIGRDRETDTGFHGLFPPASSNDCVSCHTDHEGRDADIVKLASGLFDHDYTDLPLDGTHAQLACGSCHASDEMYRDAPKDCGSCHADVDVHDGALGSSSCGSCHATTDWRGTSFDHSTTGYKLTGAHPDVACIDCHRDNQYKDTSRACVSCHAIDDVHEETNGSACYDCHSTSTWRSIGFDHESETGFALSGGHGGLTCNDCHRREDYKDDFSAGCIACHAPDDYHQGRNGTECGDCHAPSTWSDNLFSHDDTGFALLGAHADVGCAGCHKQSVATALESGCGSCHSFDDAHGGQLGQNCGSCHTQSSWTDGVAFDHDLSNFPLTGLHATAPCGACHQDARFGDTGTACIDCHRGDDTHEGTLGEACGDCHTSNGWATTVFDHDLHTDFPLDGGHADLVCTACHRESDKNASDVPSSCGGCHATDDVHDGQFGTQCGDCHTNTSFDDIEKLKGVRR